MKIGFVVLLALPASLAVAAPGNTPPEVADWFVLDPLRLHSTQMEVAAFSAHEWKVTPKDGRVVATAIPMDRVVQGDVPPFDFSGASMPRASHWSRGTKYVLRVSDGWLVGHNAGEWRGSLWWFSESGDEHRRISSDQIYGWIRAKDAILGLAGFRHLDKSEGRIIEIFLDAQNNSWQSRPYCPLSSTPWAGTFVDGLGLLVVTSSSLLLISDGGQSVTALLESACFDALPPNSIAMDEHRRAYIGMRLGVAGIDLGGGPPKMEWLVPSKEYWERELQEWQEAQERTR